MEFAHKSDPIGSASLSLRRNENPTFLIPSSCKTGRLLHARGLSINA
jgi:hypothetical protein